MEVKFRRSKLSSIYASSKAPLFGANGKAATQRRSSEKLDRGKLIEAMICAPKVLIKNVLFASLATNRFICCLFAKQCLVNTLFRFASAARSTAMAHATRLAFDPNILDGSCLDGLSAL